jgi:hypothetical protein
VSRTSSWQTAIPQCVLCGNQRREYLYVVGDARVLKCPECGLVSRDDASIPRTASYVLDARTVEWVRERIGDRKRTLQIAIGDAARIDGFTTTIDLETDPTAIEHLGSETFDAIFVNGIVDQVLDVTGFMRQLRAAIVPFGVIVVLVADDLQLLSTDAPLRNVFTPAPLIRLGISAGFRPRECGLVMRDPAHEPADERLHGERAFERTRKVLAMFGRSTELSTGLLAFVGSAEPMPARPKLSIIMPVFNEARTFADTFERVYANQVRGLDREIVVIESNSTDGSRELVQAIENRPDVTVIYEDKPRGKGHAVRAGLAASTGDILLIQDADSEYDVTDYDIVIEPLLRLTTTFVLGSRHLGRRTWKIRQFGDSKSLSTVMNVAHEFFTVLTNELYESDMRDPTTMYKVFRREAYVGVSFRRDRFDFDWELVCKLIRHGHVPIEVPINYKSRSYSEGKKVRFFRDPMTWVTTIVSSRFEPITEKPKE